MGNKSDIKVMVRSIYDLQQLRIQHGNRITANFKAKLGQAPSESEETLDAESRALLARLRSTEKLLTDNIIEIADGEPEASPEEKKTAGIISKLLEKHFRELTKGEGEELPTPRKFKGNAVISSYTEICLIKQYKEILHQEKTQFSRLEGALRDFRIYTDFLLGVKGVGPAMAGVIISELDPHRAAYASSFAKYAGIDVGPDGTGRSKKKEHLIDVEYTDRDGNQQTKKSITFNPFLKTKLTGVLASSFLKCKSPYAKHYYDYKNRLENYPAHVGKTPKHRHNMAIRRMVKVFLQDLWSNWRAMEGLSVSAPYHVSKLGLDDHGLEAELMAKYGVGFSN